MVLSTALRILSGSVSTPMQLIMIVLKRYTFAMTS